MNRRILIEKNFSSQVNQLFVYNESHSTGNPLCELMLKNKKCELASYTQDKHNKGIKFSLRAIPGVAATTIFREDLEKLILHTENIIKCYKEEYKRTVTHNPSPIII
jgi:DNA-directed RNA polymerase subunit L